LPAGAIEDSRFKYLLGTRTYTQSSQGSIQAPLRSEPPRRGGGIVESAPLFSFRAQRRRRRHAGGPEKVDGQLDAIPATRPPWPPRHEGCAARAVIQHLDAVAATHQGNYKESQLAALCSCLKLVARLSIRGLAYSRLYLPTPSRPAHAIISVASGLV